MKRKVLHCGRCHGTNFKTNHVGRLGDLAPPWWKEVDRTCRDCGNMVFTYETRGRGKKKFAVVDNGYVEEVDDTEYVTCPECNLDVKDDESAQLIDGSIVHTECL